MTKSGMSSFTMRFGCNRKVILYCPLDNGRRETFVPTMITEDIWVVRARLAKALVPVMYPMVLPSFSRKSLTISFSGGSSSPNRDVRGL